MTVPPLVYRLIKGEPLTSEDHDNNQQIIEDFLNGLAALFSVVFDASGRLKDDSVGTSAILDRAVTQRKLYWLANFFAVAAGVDDYTITINPAEDFTYGDGIGGVDDPNAGAFFCIVKFANANTTGVTLDVNGQGAKNVKKVSSAGVLIGLHAGDIAAGSVHLLVYDGTDFQLVSLIPKTDVNTPPKGIPNFIEPVIVHTASIASGWDTYDTLATDGVPDTASAIILEAEWAQTGGSDSRINVRKESGEPEYLLARGAAAGSEDATAGCNQGIYPFKNNGGVLSFDFEVITGFDEGHTIRLIGYIS